MQSHDTRPLLLKQSVVRLTIRCHFRGKNSAGSMFRDAVLILELLHSVTYHLSTVLFTVDK